MKIALVFLAVLLLSTVASAQVTPAEANQKADVLYKDGKYREAIEAYRLTLNMDPNNDHAIGYIAYAYNKLEEKTSAREWMRRRIGIPYQTPSVKSQTLTELAVLCWDEGHVLSRAVLVKSAGGVPASKDLASINKLLAEGEESAQNAVIIAPRSAKAFNILNLVYRTQATLDPQRRSELLAKADEALAKAIEIYEASAYFQQSQDMLVAPTVLSVQGAEQGAKLRIGKPKKTAAGAGSAEALIAIEVFVGRDGKVRFPRMVHGDAKQAQSAMAAARQYEFEATTFDGHAVQLIEILTFPEGQAKSSK